MVGVPRLPSPSDPSSWRARSRRAARTVRRLVLARRRSLAAVLAAVGVAAMLRATAPPAEPVVGVPVAAHDLVPGTTLAPEDLVVRDVPRALAPARVVARPTGRVLTGPLDAGEVVTETRLVGPGLAAQAPGRVAVPVRLPDAGMADLLRVGDTVDLLATDAAAGAGAGAAGAAAVVARAAPVLALDRPDASDGAAPDLPGRLVVLSVAASEVALVARASATSFVTFAWYAP